MEWHNLGGGDKLSHVVELVQGAQVDVDHQELRAPLVVEVHLPTWVSLSRKSTYVSKVTIIKFDIN